MEGRRGVDLVNVALDRVNVAYRSKKGRGDVWGKPKKRIRRTKENFIIIQPKTISKLAQVSHR